MIKYYGHFCTDNYESHRSNTYNYFQDALNSRRYDYVMPRQLCGTFNNYWFSKGTDISDIGKIVIVPYKK